MKQQRDNGVLRKSFGHRYRWPNVYPADLPVLNDVSCDDAALRESRNWSSARFAARALISSLVCTLVLLTLVAVAAWIVISPGAGHAAWQ